MAEGTTVICTECGIPFVTRRKNGVRCSPECRAAYHSKRKRTGKKKPRSGICEWCGKHFTHEQSTPQRACSYTCAGYLARTKSLSCPVPWRQCDQCEQWFVSRQVAKRCSAACRRRAQVKWEDGNSERIMRLYRLAIANLEIPQASMWRRTLTDHLARRDGDHCAICHKPVDLTLSSGPRGDRLGPSIDHVIPVSQGGLDTMANVRLTHWDCNHKRGNRGGDEQLRLVG